MIHTSPEPIEKGDINPFGVAGDCLFFSDGIYMMTESSTVYVYEADFDCVPVYKLYDEEIINDIAERFRVDLETAEKILDGRASEYHDKADAEDSWWLQGKRGECGKKMGFDGCEDIDEQGTVYIVPMTGREDELELVEIIRKGKYLRQGFFGSVGIQDINPFDPLPKDVWIHGRSSRHDLNTGHIILCSKSWDVGIQYSTEDGGVWLIQPKPNARLINMNEPQMLNLVIKAITEDFFSGNILPEYIEEYIEREGNPDDDYEDSIKSLSMEFNPKNIVESAEAFDNYELVNWFGDHFDPSAVITNDGLVVYDIDDMYTRNLGVIDYQH